MTASLSRLLVCALLAIALLPAAAQADVSVPELPVPAADALTSTAHGLAVARWGMDPCGGQVAVTWAHMGAGINARSQWMSTDVHNPATYSQCSITYNRDVEALSTLKFNSDAYTAPAGKVQFHYSGATGHTLAIQDPAFDGFLLTTDAGGPKKGSVLLKAGQKYTIYCNVPGHEAAGMKATVTVS